MLRDAISEKEYYMMEHYITYNSNSTGSTSAYDLLSIWAKQKETLYELLGNKLIYSKSICYKRGWDELEDVIFKFLIDEYNHWRFTRHSKYPSDKIIIFQFMDEVDKLIDEKAIFMEHFLASIFRFIKIRCINCFFEIGNSKNAQIASMGSGLFLTFMYSLYGMLFTLKGEFECILGAEMTVDENKLNVGKLIASEIIDIEKDKIPINNLITKRIRFLHIILLALIAMFLIFSKSTRWRTNENIA